ncbi:UNVERIFIED_CONTAM: hypothetical protein PYX00_008548 [Menopon gallinae]|uniref:Uncharacterized protein n=1 Tax=Menopon gallinae TaxID=328185 RepID=A0AAW2HPD0_9NEOP
MDVSKKLVRSLSGDPSMPHVSTLQVLYYTIFFGGKSICSVVIVKRIKDEVDNTLLLLRGYETNDVAPRIEEEKCFTF